MISIGNKLYNDSPIYTLLMPKKKAVGKKEYALVEDIDIFKMSEGIVKGTSWHTALLGESRTHNKNDLNYVELEDFYYSDHLVYQAINLIADYVLSSGFSFKDPDKPGKETRAVKFVSDWAKKVDLYGAIHRLVREWLIYGISYIELDVKGRDMKRLVFLHPSTMQIDRDLHGNLTSITQSVSFGKEGLITWKGEKLKNITYSSLNEIGVSPYGTGVIEPIRDILQVKRNIETDVGNIVKRYASPIRHIKVGTDRFPAQPTAVTNVQTELKKLTLGEDIVTRHNIEVSVIESELKMDVIGIYREIYDATAAGLGVPLLLLGKPEGANKASSDTELIGFDRRVSSLQIKVNTLMENFILKRLLELNELKEGAVMMTWGVLGVSDPLIQAQSWALLMKYGVISREEVRSQLAVKLNLTGPPPEKPVVDDEEGGPSKAGKPPGTPMDHKRIIENMSE